MLADINHHDVSANSDPNDPVKLIADLRARADKLSKEAEDIAKSGKPNPEAQLNYTKAAAILHQRASDTFAQWQASLQQKLEAAKQQEARKAASQQQVQQLPNQQQYMPPTTGGYGR
jgi:uncharacterized protein involved in exopolysaccharide biosynthesis